MLRRSSDTVELPDQEVETEVGSFSFRNLILRHDAGGCLFSTMKLHGAVINGTGKTWRSVYFDCQFLNSGGGVVDRVPVQFNQIAPGTGTPVSELPSLSKLLTFPGGLPEGDFRIIYKGGEIDTKYVLHLTRPIESDSLSVEDANMSILFSPANGAMGFTLRNKTEGPIRIDWNQASYIDSEGISHSVKGAASNRPLTVIPPTAKIVDSIAGHILPHAPLRAPLQGKSIGIYLPMEINGSIRNYLFTFRIADVLY